VKDEYTMYTCLHTRGQGLVRWKWHCYQQTVI
jgi:hypothetical protein